MVDQEASPPKASVEVDTSSREVVIRFEGEPDGELLLAVLRALKRPPSSGA